MTIKSELLDEVGDMTAAMESSEEPPTYEEAYNMLLRAFIHIRKLQRANHTLEERIRILEGRPS